MDKLAQITPEQVLQIGVIVAAVFVAVLVWQVRDELIQFFDSVRRRFFYVPALDQLTTQIADGNMSSSRVWEETGISVDTPDTDAVEPVSEPLRTTPKNQFANQEVSRHLGELDVVAMLAVQRKDDGSYRYSANAIYKLVGGTRAEVMRVIAHLRPNDTEAQPEPEPGPRLVPALDENGQPIKNRFVRVN